jgi:uncharacterized membrane protein HdeD (DUF308 family)
MTTKLIWGILGGVVLGAAFGTIAGNTAIGIAICIAAGAIAAGIWEYMERRRLAGGVDSTDRSPRA